MGRIGILIITTFSVMWFHESLSPLKLGGLALLIAGITLIKYGTKSAEKAACCQTGSCATE